MSEYLGFRDPGVEKNNTGYQDVSSNISFLSNISHCTHVKEETAFYIINIYIYMYLYGSTYTFKFLKHSDIQHPIIQWLIGPCGI